MRFTLVDFKKVTPEDFFILIEKNRDHLEDSFSKILSFCKNIEDTNNFIANNQNEMKEGKSLPFCIINLDTNELIGYIKILNINSEIPKCELTYFTDINNTGKGIMSTALSKIIFFAFEKLKMNKIIVQTIKDNTGSQKVVKKNGFIEEGILRNEFIDSNGKFHDIVYLGLLKNDWKKSISK